MPRLITLLFILIALAVLAVQNRANTLSLTLLSSETPEIPLGLLLVGAIGVGSLLTLILYGLVGVGRPPESKYRPMGKRVPYPDSPGSTNLPPSGPSSTSPSDKPYRPQGATTYGSGSTAFVSEPSAPSPVTTPSSPVSPPQDRFVQDSPVAANPSVAQDPPLQNRADVSGPSSSAVSGDKAPSDSGKSPSDSASKAPFGKGIANTFKNHFGGQAPSPPVPDNAPSPTPKTNIDPATDVKKKTKFGGSFRKRPAEAAEPDRKIGDDWGDLRTVEHRNSWEAAEEDHRRGQKRGLFDFLPGGAARDSANRLADDIAAGWQGYRSAQSPAGATGYEEDSRYSASGYQDSRYEDAEGYRNQEYAARYQNDRYGDGQYGDQYGGQYGDSQYRDSQYSDLDEGWENFDNYDDPPPRDASGAVDGKRVYGDSLYGNEEDYPEGPYPEDPYPEDPESEMGPEGVYEADYRVIEPPSKPLEELD
ncbi:MAG: hypothetical protein AAFN38_12710 [Cyanobacteria bacterium J06560_5]